MTTAKNVRKKLVPPDGGYGWVIAIAMAVNSFIYVPMFHCFGLIFKDEFAELELSAAEGSLIINLHAAFGMLTGMLNGVLLKKFGYRKIALFASVLYFSGVTSTSFATHFMEFIVMFGMVASLGTGMSRSAYNLALNSYFKKQRSRAMSLQLTITAMGNIIMPQFINLLMKYYTPQGVILIFGGVTAHFFVTAMLLHPVEWHVEASETFTTPTKQIQLDGDQLEKKKKKPIHHVVKLFDLDLLKDPIFVNILIGTALTMFSELNFTVLTPFILNEYHLSTDQIATFLSALSIGDIVLRMLAPYIGEFSNKSPRFLVAATLAVLILVRSVFLVTKDYHVLVGVAVSMGMARGIRRVYAMLLIPSHVSLEKLPSASGMEMMANGFCILTGGAVLGVVRDMTGSYYSCIIIMNCVTAVPIAMWTIEAALVSRQKNVKASDVEQLPLNEI